MLSGHNVSQVLGINITAFSYSGMAEGYLHLHKELKRTVLSVRLQLIGSPEEFHAYSQKEKSYGF